MRRRLPRTARWVIATVMVAGVIALNRLVARWAATGRPPSTASVRWGLAGVLLAAVIAFGTVTYQATDWFRRRAKVVRRRRRRAGRCEACNYDLTGNASGVCPECGAAILKPAPAHSS